MLFISSGRVIHLFEFVDTCVHRGRMHWAPWGSSFFLSLLSPPQHVAVLARGGGEGGGGGV